MQQHEEALKDSLLNDIYYEKESVIQTIKELYISSKLTKEDIQKFIKLKICTKCFYGQNRIIGPITMIFALNCEKFMQRRQIKPASYQLSDFDRRVLEIIN